MIDKSTVKRLAEQLGFEALDVPILSIFAQKVIEEYKASLEPMAWMTKDNFFNHVKTEHYAIPLYALLLGETK